MQKIFEEVATLDRRAYDDFFLTPDILMEHAANGMAEFILKHFSSKAKVLIVVGSGNNGADGIALARLLHKKCKVKLFYFKEAKSQMALLQKQRSEAIGVRVVSKISSKYDVVVDAIVGTGFNGVFDEESLSVIEKLNKLKTTRIACDVPSGYVFKADITLSMGGLKREMFLDKHKSSVGKIEVLDLGLTREIYEKTSNWHLLEMSDLKLPKRDKEDTHKGSYGHLLVVYGEKGGAALLSALSAERFGAGLVSLLSEEKVVLPYSLMVTKVIPENTTALCIGMGLGDTKIDEGLLLEKKYPIVADADIFTHSILYSLLSRENIVLTPHPKEFVSMLSRLDLAEITIQELQEKRFYYVELFSQAYPQVVLLLKGANVIIAHNGKYFVNPHGKVSLAKGGSGDVLSGLIGALLSQGFTPLSAALNASLTHAKLSKKKMKNNFSLIAEDLIDGLKDV